MHASLLAELGRIAQAGTTGTIGFAVAHMLQRGGGSLVPPVGLRTGELFPMASTFKVPMACVVLRMVDEGRMKLTDEIRLSLSDVRPGTGVLSARLLQNGGADTPENVHTVQKLLELAMNDSDNAATDMLLRLIGGPAAVTEYCRGRGLQQLTVCRGCLEHLRDRCGVPPQRTPAAELLCEPGAPQPSGPEVVDFVAMLEGKMEVLPLAHLQEADERYDADPRDQTSPADMNALLQLIWQRQAGLSESSTAVLLDIMVGCRTGKNRMPGRMPAHVLQQPRAIMHKTGSLGGRSNDVGIVQLPENRGAIAIAAYAKGPAGPGQTTTAEMYAERDRVIADLSRACYDYFLFRDA
mmetsp:Transcript_12922/g.40774  ORF Transcript_12922/g.40774 Transcript_12922/m.40774 type:complete len:352 (+) Transcript_12922:133-1188(+)